jgi:hypothetical protein
LTRAQPEGRAHGPQEARAAAERQQRLITFLDSLHFLSIKPVWCVIANSVVRHVCFGS